MYPTQNSKGILGIIEIEVVIGHFWSQDQNKADFSSNNNVDTLKRSQKYFLNFHCYLFCKIQYTCTLTHVSYDDP